MHELFSCQEVCTINIFLYTIEMPTYLHIYAKSYFLHLEMNKVLTYLKMNQIWTLIKSSLHMFSVTRNWEMGSCDISIFVSSSKEFQWKGGKMKCQPLIIWRGQWKFSQMIFFWDPPIGFFFIFFFECTCAIITMCFFLKTFRIDFLFENIIVPALFFSNFHHPF